MICRTCAEAADIETSYQAVTGEPSGDECHPEDCGCTCQHYPVGTIQIQRKEKS